MCQKYAPNSGHALNNNMHRLLRYTIDAKGKLFKKWRLFLSRWYDQWCSFKTHLIPYNNLQFQFVHHIYYFTVWLYLYINDESPFLLLHHPGPLQSAPSSFELPSLEALTTTRPEVPPKPVGLKSSRATTAKDGTNHIIVHTHAAWSITCSCLWSSWSVVLIVVHVCTCGLI